MEKAIIGIDISSKTLDICIRKKNSTDYFTIDNKVKEIKKFLKQKVDSNAIIAMENTGRYNWNI